MLRRRSAALRTAAIVAHISQPIQNQTIKTSIYYPTDEF